MDIKLFFGITAAIITVVAYYPYIRDIFQGKTKPHAYTWLIWGITQGTAAAILLYGGGNFGAISLVAGTLLVLFVFLLSFKYGTKSITKIDTAVLIVALLAVAVWWQLNNPLLAVLMVSAIDGLGYIPTFRKSFVEPWSETLSFWTSMVVVNFLILLSLSEYNFLTVTYIATLAAGNIAVLIICIVRRIIIPKPV
ncbi:MAG TPA: hypothetical protein ENI63_01055 [Candidatus Kaiserbacteria bacterium]|nr:hypothetical protein [Candidatus Kaiserbacteria bacterium]